MPPRRTWSSSLLMSTPVLILLLLIFALAFILFTLFSLKRTWDSFNFSLILFTVILCGVFARQNDDESCTSYQQHAFTTAVLAPSDGYVNLRIAEEGGYVTHQWFGFGFSFYDSEESMGYNIYHTPPIRLHSPATDRVTVKHRKRRVGVEEEEDNVKEIPVDNFENRSSTTTTTPPPKSPAHPLSTASPPPLPPHPAKVGSENTHGKSEKKKSNVKKEIAMVWASVLSNQKNRKKKKQRRKAIHSHDSHNTLHSSSELPNNSREPPPPSIFGSLFKKGLCRDNKIHAVSAPTPLRRKTMPAVNAGNQLPLITVAPLPPPPLKLPEMELVVGDGSGSGSPERVDVDVDVRATTFIAKLKHEWKLERLKSIKERANFRPCHAQAH